MRKLAERVSNDVVEHLNRVLRLDDPMTFQKMVIDITLSRHELALVAKSAGVRRETIWRYKSGAAHAPFGTLIKIIALVGAKLVIVCD